MIAEPLLEPAVKATDIVPDTPAAEATRLVGASGPMAGVAGVAGVEAVNWSDNSIG